MRINLNANEQFNKEDIFAARQQNDFQAKVSQIIAIIVRKKLLLLFWCIIVSALAVLYMKITPSTYSSEASIILEPRKQGTTTSELLANTSNVSLDSPQADSQIQVIKSERLLKAVFDKLKIGELDEFKFGNPTFLENIVSYIGLRTQKDSLQQMDQKNRDAIAFINFSSRLNVRRIGQSYVLELSIYSINAETAAKLANSIAMQYIKQQIELKAAFSQSGSEYLQGRIARFQTQIDLAESAVKTGIIPETVFPDADAKVIGSAAVPLNRSSPQRSIVAAFALIVGPLGGVAMVLILGMLDTTIRDEKYLRSVSRVECLASLRRDLLNTNNMRYSIDSPVRKGSLRHAVISFDSSLQEIKSFLMSLPSWTNAKAIGVVSLPGGSDFQNLSFRIANGISDEKVSLLFVRNLEHEWLEDERSGMNIDAQVNEAVSSGSFEENVTGVSCLKNKDLIIISLKEFGDSHESNRFIDPILSKVLSTYGSDKRILVDIPSIGLMKRFRSALSKFTGVVVVVDSKFVKESDWKSLEENLEYIDVDILATILILK